MASTTARGCTITRLAGDSIRVDHAEPQTIIAAAVLDWIKSASNPNITLNGDVLKIHGINRTVIYRIGEKVHDLHAYHAEWPD